MYSMIDDELTHLDESIARLDRAIYENRLALNSTPRINASGVRTRNSHGVETDTGRNDRTSRRPGRRLSADSTRDDIYDRGMARGPDARSGRRLGLSPVREPTIHYTHPSPRSSAGDQDVARSKISMKPATYDGTGLWNDYLSHFESVSLLNHWTETEKGLYLAASLRGQALGILGNQPKGDRQNYTRLVQSLQDRFAPSNQTELYRAQLRERRQKASESLPEMGQDVRRLTNLAYPSASSDLKEILAIEQFLDGLYDSEMRLKIKQARPSSLNDAIQRAVELEAFNRAEKRRTETVRWMEHKSSARSPKLEKLIEAMQKSIDTLTREVRVLKRSKCQGNQTKTEATTSKVCDRSGEASVRLRCYKCGSTEHLRRDCSHIQRNQAVSMDVANPTHCATDTRYVSVVVNGLPINLLVDTGATVSLLSKAVFDTMGKTDDTITKVKGDVLSTNGSPLKVLGKTSIELKLADKAWVQDVIIADLNVDGILGMDFLVKHRCIINFYTGLVSIPGIEQPIKMQRPARTHPEAVVNIVSQQTSSQGTDVGTACGADYGELKAMTGKVQHPVETKEDENILCWADQHQDSTRSLRTKLLQGKTTNSSHTWGFRSNNPARQLVRRLRTISSKNKGMGHRARKLYGGGDRLGQEPCGRRKLGDTWEKSSSSPRHGCTQTVDDKTPDVSWQYDSARLGQAQDDNMLRFRPLMCSGVVTRLARSSLDQM